MDRANRERTKAESELKKKMITETYVKTIVNENNELKQIEKSLINGDYYYNMGIKPNNEIKITISSSSDQLTHDNIFKSIKEALRGLSFINQTSLI